jgi:hypothetical protein
MTRENAARAAFALAAMVLLLLAALHVLSPEFDPSWRVVSEYANGRYGWVLSLMFACWALSTWALAYAIRPLLTTTAGKTGWWFLVVAGVGDALAAFFDINQPMHGVAGLLGVVGLPVAALTISMTLVRNPAWSPAGKQLLWTANLTWIVLLLMVASLPLMFVTYVHAGGHVPANGAPLPLGTVLPAGVIALVGYFNRLLIVVYCAWAMVTAWYAAELNGAGKHASQ